LLSKIQVPVSAIEAISIRIHKIRDEELQAQVNELIIGYFTCFSAIIMPIIALGEILLMA
jgi:hypothetical protein